MKRALTRWRNYLETYESIWIVRREYMKRVIMDLLMRRWGTVVSAMVECTRGRGTVRMDGFDEGLVFLGC